MRRGLYFLAGTAAGAYATSRLRRAAEALTVDGVHDRLTGWFAGARVLGAEARAAMAEKEAELRGRLPAPAGLPASDARPLPGSHRLELTDTLAPYQSSSTPKRGDD